MKSSFALVFPLAALCLTGKLIPLCPGEETDCSTNSPAAPTIRVQVKRLTPEERQAKIREGRARHSLTNEPASQPPEESSKIRVGKNAPITALRQQHAAAKRQLFGGAAARERQAKLKMKRAELRKKEADGTLTPEEKKLIPHLEQAIKRFDQSAEGGEAETQPVSPKP